MKKKEKDLLLLKDLSSRLPHGVMCKFTLVKSRLDVTDKLGLGGLGQFMCGKTEIIPYLRPMSSMTEDEENEYSRLTYIGATLDDLVKGMDFLNANHFDYRGLIDMGLALEAPVDMYKKVVEK